MTNENPLAKIRIPTDPNDRAYNNKHMSALTERNRMFVIKMLQQGINPKAAARAAVECGYDAQHGYLLMRDDKIITALKEEATKRLMGAALLGVNVMVDIAQTPGHKDQYKAAKDLAAINGFTAEQRIVVEHIGDDAKAQIRQVREMAAQLGLDPKTLIEGVGIIDAEFEEVKTAVAADVAAQLEVDTDDW